MIKALVLCDDFWHPAPTPRSGLIALNDAGFTFDWIEDAHEWSAERMSAYPVTILTKSNNMKASDPTPWVTPEVESAFVNYVTAGNGLLVLHSGAAGYENTPRLRALMGGVFVQHPPQCMVTYAPSGDHALTVGMHAFSAQDEHYHMAFDDPQAEIFLTSTSEHGEQPAGWARREGAGRVGMLTPGHNLAVWLDLSYQLLLRNTIQWCAGRIH